MSFRFSFPLRYFVVFKTHTSIHSGMYLIVTDMAQRYLFTVDDSQHSVKSTKVRV